MRKFIGGGLALGFAAAGTVLFAGPTSAGSLGDLDASLSTETPAPGETVTAKALEGCPDVQEGETFYWEVSLPAGNADDPVFSHGEAGFDGGNGWSATFTAPTEPGNYAFWGWCPEDDLNDYVVTFTVAAPTTTTVPDSTAPAPAPAVPGRPTITG
jgi:hypothetical protein